MQLKNRIAVKLVKGVALITVVPISVILAYAIVGPISVEHAAMAVIVMIAVTGVLVYSYVANITVLTDYVNSLALDKKTAGA